MNITYNPITGHFHAIIRRSRGGRTEMRGDGPLTQFVHDAIKQAYEG